jgi:hypothetical protein
MTLALKLKEKVLDTFTVQNDLNKELLYGNCPLTSLYYGSLRISKQSGMD